LAAAGFLLVGAARCMREIRLAGVVPFKKNAQRCNLGTVPFKKHLEESNITSVRTQNSVCNARPHA
jgi:hypothetical protein